MSEWMTAKSEQMIRREIDLIGKSECPDPKVCEGMVEMAYALSLLTDISYAYWLRRLELAVRNRRFDLRQERNRRLTQGVPA
ncbi:MAG: hypothetical protein ACLGID_00385 [Gammaproteobacteria bacterium]